LKLPLLRNCEEFGLYTREENNPAPENRSATGELPMVYPSDKAHQELLGKMSHIISGIDPMMRVSVTFMAVWPSQDIEPRLVASSSRYRNHISDEEVETNRSREDDFINRMADPNRPVEVDYVYNYSDNNGADMAMAHFSVDFKFREKNLILSVLTWSPDGIPGDVMEEIALHANQLWECFYELPVMQ
jgi:hypothetical protein